MWGTHKRVCTRTRFVSAEPSTLCLILGNHFSRNSIGLVILYALYDVHNFFDIGVYQTLDSILVISNVVILLGVFTNCSQSAQNLIVLLGI